MKILKLIKYISLAFVILVNGCSEAPPKPSSELPTRDLLPVLGVSWWDISLPKDFDPKISEGEGVHLVIRDSAGNIIGGSAVLGALDMGESVRVVIQRETDSGRMTAYITNSKSSVGATLPIVVKTELNLVGTRNSGMSINVGDTLIKWKIKGSSEEKTTRNTFPWDTIQEGEAGLSLEVYPHKS